MRRSMRLCHPPDGNTSPKYKLLCFITTKKICKEKNAPAFNWDRCCHLVLCLRLIPFHSTEPSHSVSAPCLEQCFVIHKRICKFLSKTCKLCLIRKCKWKWKNLWIKSESLFSVQILFNISCKILLTIHDQILSRNLKTKRQLIILFNFSAAF